MLLLIAGLRLSDEFDSVLAVCVCVCEYVCRFMCVCVKESTWWNIHVRLARRTESYPTVHLCMDWPTSCSLKFALSSRIFELDLSRVQCVNLLFAFCTHSCSTNDNDNDVDFFQIFSTHFNCTSSVEFGFWLLVGFTSNIVLFLSFSSRISLFLRWALEVHFVRTFG